MTKYTYVIQINPGVPLGKLLKRSLIVSKSIISKVLITKSMIILRPHGATSPVPHADNNKS